MTTDQVALGIGYADPQLDEQDIMRQIDCCKLQGMLKSEADRRKIIDRRYGVSIACRRVEF